MAKKIEIIGSALVVTDTVSGLVEVSQPAKDAWYNEDYLKTDVIKFENIRFISETTEADIYEVIPMADAVNSALVAFTESTFRTFCLSNLGSASSTASSLSKIDPWVEHAIEIIKADDGVDVSLEAKNKDLLKFGRNKLVGVSKTTLMTLPTGTDNEVLLTANDINSIISNNAGDTETVRVEGHTTSDGGLTFVFVAQNAILNGQTVVPLATPLARVSRVVNVSATDLTGRVYVTETDTYTAGVPDTDSKVHLIVEAGLNNSEKAATTLSNADYWVVTGFYGDCLEKTSNFGILHLEVRESGKTFSNKIDISATTNSRGNHEFKPYLIVKPNSDIRLRVTSGTASKDFSGGIQGALLTSV